MASVPSSRRPTGRTWTPSRAPSGRAASRHCVSDVDDESTPLVDFQTEDAIVAVVGGDGEELVAEVVHFGLEYGARARADHALFVDAFRGGQIPGVGPSSARA
jgi:hypothetical protein